MVLSSDAFHSCLGFSLCCSVFRYCFIVMLWFDVIVPCNDASIKITETEEFSFSLIISHLRIKWSGLSTNITFRGFCCIEITNDMIML